MDAIQNMVAFETTEKEAISALVDKLRLNWAELEAYKIGDQKKVKELMEEYMKGNGQ